MKRNISGNSEYEIFSNFNYTIYLYPDSACSLYHNLWGVFSNEINVVEWAIGWNLWIRENLIKNEVVGFVWGARADFWGPGRRRAGGGRRPPFRPAEWKLCNRYENLNTSNCMGKNPLFSGHLFIGFLVKKFNGISKF